VIGRCSPSDHRHATGTRIRPPDGAAAYTQIGITSEGGKGMSVEAADTVSIPRVELEALRAELKRLRREVGRGVARARMQADPGPGDQAPTFTREQLADAWGISE